MVDRAGAPAAAGPIAICVGGTIILIGCAAAVLLSIISQFSPYRAGEVYGAEFQCTVGLKFLYGNSTSRYLNSIVRNSTALSSAATTQLEATGVQNVLGVLLYNGRAWDAANNSITARRRRRQSTPSSAGMYYFGTANIYRQFRCPKRGDLNKYESSSKLSKCVSRDLKAANSLVGGTSGTTLLAWASLNRVLIEVQDMTSTYQNVAIDRIYGMPGNIAVAVAANLQGASGYSSALTLGCRFSRILSLTQITAILNSQVSVASTDSSTAVG